MARETANDTLGKIEKHGINFIPHIDRHSNPRNVFWILYGGSITFSIIVIGAIPVSLGLSWWASFWAVAVGAFVGSLLLAPMALLSPRTGTNNPIGSGAHFGVVGRVVGSVLALIISVIFTALAIWTSGDAVIAGLARLIGTPDGTGPRLVGYLVLTVIVTGISIYGHANMLAAQKVIGVVGTVVVVAAVIVLLPKFHAGFAGTGLALGGFWPTWFAGAAPVALTVFGYALAIGDWTRYISPDKHSNASLITATILGGTFGMGAPILFGAFIATMVADAANAWTSGFVDIVPMWFVPAVIAMGLFAGSAQGAINMYSTGLDMSSIFPRLKRVPGTALVGIASLALVGCGLLISDLIAGLTTVLAFLSVGFACFVTITTVGYWNHRGQYDPDDLQVFTRREEGGRYWYTRGWNLRSLVAFGIACVIGILSISTSGFQGPLAAVFGGVDISFLVAALLGPVVYLALAWMFPEPITAYACGNPRLRPRTRTARAVAQPSSGTAETGTAQVNAPQTAMAPPAVGAAPVPSPSD